MAINPTVAEVRVECALANFQLGECLGVPLGVTSICLQLRGYR